MPRCEFRWLDDHSRYLLGMTACARVAGDDVVATFAAAGETCGWPASTLTDIQAWWAFASSVVGRPWKDAEVRLPSAIAE